VGEKLHKREEGQQEEKERERDGGEGDKAEAGGISVAGAKSGSANHVTISDKERSKEEVGGSGGARRGNREEKVLDAVKDCFWLMNNF
jgi:hypothetical protein